MSTHNAAEAPPNPITPFWMLPLLGFLQLVMHLPAVLFLLGFLARTPTYAPPVNPG